MSWDYSKKVECNNIANIWKMIFQALNGKGKQFLKLCGDNSNDIELSYVKGSPWLQVFKHSNTLCIHVMRAITNHSLIVMLLSENIDLDSSLRRNSSVHVVFIPLNPEDTFSMIVVGSTAIGIQEGTRLATLLCF